VQSCAASSFTISEMYSISADRSHFILARALSSQGESGLKRRSFGPALPGLKRETERTHGPTGERKRREGGGWSAWRRRGGRFRAGGVSELAWPPLSLVLGGFGLPLGVAEEQRARYC
jgi:hypothetical protein